MYYPSRSRRMVLVGKIVFGDVQGGTGARDVEGDILSAEVTESTGNHSKVLVNIPEQIDVRYMVQLTIEGLGVLDDDNDIEVPIVYDLTTSSFKIYLFESIGTTQNLHLNVMIVKY